MADKIKEKMAALRLEAEQALDRALEAEKRVKEVTRTVAILQHTVTQSAYFLLFLYPSPWPCCTN